MKCSIEEIREKSKKNQEKRLLKEEKIEYRETLKIIKKINKEIVKAAKEGYTSYRGYGDFTFKQREMIREYFETRLYEVYWVGTEWITIDW